MPRNELRLTFLQGSFEPRTPIYADKDKMALVFSPQIRDMPKRY